jgi:hypothetical protein
MHRIEMNVQTGVLRYLDENDNEIDPTQLPEETVLVRARNEDGTYMADDPATPDVDEAYVEVPLSEA